METGPILYAGSCKIYSFTDSYIKRPVLDRNFNQKLLKLGDVPSSYATCSLAEKELGWKAEHSLYNMCKFQIHIQATKGGAMTFSIATFVIMKMVIIVIMTLDLTIKMTLNIIVIMTQVVMITIILTLVAMTLPIMMLYIMTQSIMTLLIMTLVAMTLSHLP